MDHDDQSDELGQLLIKLTFIAQQLDQRSEQAVQRVESSGVALDQAALEMREGSERLAREVLRIVAAQAQQVITDSVGQVSAQLSSQLQEGAHSAQKATQGLQAQRTQLNRAQTTLVWKGLAALIIGSLLAMVGTGYFAWQSMQQIDRAKFGQDILQAVQSGELTHCDKVLCARVGKRPRHYGVNGDYVLLGP